MVISSKLFKFRFYYLIILLVPLGLFLYGSFHFNLPRRFNSPDEAANAYFAHRLAQGYSLTAPAGLNEITLEPIVHPRSTHIIKGQLAPASFLGLPLLIGFLGRIFGQSIMPLITPLAAIIGLSCFYWLVRELSDKRSALIAVLLLAFHPAFWYYHSRSFYHNALFFDFLLLAIVCLMLAIKNGKPWPYLAGGLALGAALAMRTSEIFWLVTCGLIWLSLNWHQVVVRYLWLLILGALISFLPVFVTNYSIYGSIISVGYSQDLKQVTNIPQALGLLPQLLLPFGFHPRVILFTAKNYLWQLIWWWAIFVMVGLVYFLFTWRQQTKQAQKFLLVVLLISVWLVVVYGSWLFNDNPDPNAITIGTSYVRYWLPVFSLLLWPAAVFISKVWQKKWGRVLVFGLFGGYIILSINLVWWEPLEGLGQIKANVKRFENWNREVQALTEPNSVIVTGLTDKIFWPERSVIYNLASSTDYQAVVRLVQNQIPVYWFRSTLRPDDLKRINLNLKNYNLGLAIKQYGWQDFSLYQFYLLN